ncbi:MAG: sugar transferase [Spirochaetales bacterium]|uniref:Sugar transferase n=1 Tax=Candidatus Thalassospirochaeta sargassi TaxID=3119039 RepID=A0AAJ1MJX6_9SPIO|nr:sugar transferase [Spirochaetales bacterium]
MKRNNLKITAITLLHSLVFIIVVLIFKRFDNHSTSNIHMLYDFISLLMFSSIIFLVLWKKLYSKPFHIYLRGAFSISVISVCLLLLIFFMSEMLILTIPAVNSRLGMDVNRSIFKFTISGGSLLVFIAVQYLWVLYLAKLGIFYKNSIIFGIYDDRIPLSNLFQDLHGTKECLGQVVNRDGSWFVRGLDDDDFNLLELDVYDYLKKNKINELILCVSPNSSEYLDEIAAFCHEHCIGYYLISDIRMLPNRFPWNRTLDSIPIIERYCPNRDSLIMVSLKRLFDIAASAVGLILLSPVFLIISVLIVKTDGFPVLYRSTRIGIHGRPMKFYKFRTMVKNAEALKAELLKYNERPDGPLFKMKDDPRVTKIGRFLRKTSLDELPQLWNVLKGDMSLIGPRPHLPEEVDEYDNYDHLRLECMPGVSCLPQIKGRDDLGFREWVDLDLEYRKNWTFMYDFKILWQTAKVVLDPVLKRRS